MAGELFWLFLFGIIYSYLGYPVLLTVCAALVPARQSLSPYFPTVTLLIAAFNEEKVLAAKLENSLMLDYPKELLQIVVAADGSDDGTVAVVRQFAASGVELVYQPERHGKMAAIQRAMATARGEIVVFSDANNLYAPDAMQELVKPFAEDAIGAVSGAKGILKGDGSLGEAEGLYWRYESFIKRQESRLGCCVGVAGEIFAMRRRLFESCPPDIINDDFYLALRLIKRGFSIWYEPKARSFERVSLSAADEVERRSRIVAGRYQAMSLAARLLPFSRPVVVWQIVSHKFLRPLVPFCMIGAVAANLLVVWRPAEAGVWSWRQLSPPLGWLLLGSQALFYLLAVAGNMRPGKTGKLLYLPTFVYNSNVAALLGLLRFLGKRHGHLWTRVNRRETESR